MHRRVIKLYAGRCNMAQLCMHSESGRYLSTYGGETLPEKDSWMMWYAWDTCDDSCCVLHLCCSLKIIPDGNFLFMLVPYVTGG